MKEKSPESVEFQRFQGFFRGTPEGTRTPNIQNRKQNVKMLLSVDTLGLDGFLFFCPSGRPSSLFGCAVQKLHTVV